MDSIGRLVLFFIIIKDVIQILAWMIIFGNIKIRDLLKKQNQNKEFFLYKVEKLVKKESNPIFYVMKLIFYELYNLIITLYHSFKMIHYALFFSFLNLIKATPFFIHFYF